MTQVIYLFLLRYLKIVLYGTLWLFVLDLTSTLIAFVFYHISMTLAVGGSMFLTKFTINLLNIFILGLLILLVGKAVFKLLHD